MVEIKIGFKSYTRQVLVADIAGKVVLETGLEEEVWFHFKPEERYPSCRKQGCSFYQENGDLPRVIPVDDFALAGRSANNFPTSTTESTSSLRNFVQKHSKSKG